MLPRTDQVPCKGQLLRFYRTFPRPDGFFIGTFGVLKPGIEKITIQGYADKSLKEGDYVELTADYAGQDKFKPSVPSYKIAACRPWFPDLSAFLGYLRTRCRKFALSNKDNAGAARAAWTVYGQDLAATVFDDPAGVAQKLKSAGFPDAAVDGLISSLAERNAMNAIKSLLPGIAQATAQRILSRLHADAPHIIKQNPYVLLDMLPGEPGLDFHAIDAWAAALGTAPDSKTRITAGVRAAMRGLLADGDFQTNISGGHVCLPCNDPGWHALIWKTIETKLGTNVDHGAVMDVLRDGGAGVELEDAAGQVWMYDADLLACEKSTAAQLKLWARSKPVINLSPGEIRAGIADYAANYGVTPTAAQMTAVMTALRNRVSVITGGPGSGKTTAMAMLAYVWAKYADGKACERAPILAAPTGMAVRNLSGALRKLNLKNFEFRSGTVASCIVGLKDSRPDRKAAAMDKFDKGRRSLVILDETSMLGLSDFAAFLSLVPAAQVVFVGDPDQLPSIAPGETFLNVICAKTIPVTNLTGNNRVAKNAMAIARNAARILSGNGLDDMEIQAGTCEFRPYPASQDFDGMCADALGAYLDLLRQNTDPREIAVLSPTKTAVARMNRDIQDAINPAVANPAGAGGLLDGVPGVTIETPGTDVASLKYYDASAKTYYHARVGSRIVITKNMRLEDGTLAVNGDRGILKAWFCPDADDQPEAFRVLLDGRTEPVWIRADDFEDECAGGIAMTLGYATTVHKAQGCEFDYVMLLLDYRTARCNPGFANRNLLYTAVTRARRELVILGSKAGFDNMAATQRPYRWSLLGQRVAGLC